MLGTLVSQTLLNIVALAVLAAAGGTLAGLSTFSTAVAIGCVVTSAAGSRLDFEVSAALTLATVAAFLIYYGLGGPIFDALGQPDIFRTELVAAGGLAILLALAADGLLTLLQRVLTPWNRVR